MRLIHALACAAALASSPGIAMATADDQARTILEDGYQVELPEQDDSHCVKDEDALACAADADRVRSERKETSNEKERLRRKLDELSPPALALSPEMASLLEHGWAFVAAALLAIALLVLVRFFLGRRTVRQRRTEVEGTSLVGALSQRTGDRSVDSFIAESDWNLAVHALLLDALRQIATHVPLVDRPSATSREIVAAAPESMRTNLGALVELVELSLFAGQPLGESHYLEARENFERLREVLNG